MPRTFIKITNQDIYEKICKIEKNLENQNDEMKRLHADSVKSISDHDTKLRMNSRMVWASYGIMFSLAVFLLEYLKK